MRKLYVYTYIPSRPSTEYSSWTKLTDKRWKIAHRCGAKHISKSKCTQHLSSGPLLEVEVLNKCTLLWREAHFEVKMYKTQHSRTTFGSWDVKKVHTVVARSTFWNQNVQNTPFSDHFWKLRCWKSARCCGVNTFWNQNVQSTPFSDHFWKLRCWKCARCCGAKHILKSKCTKHTILGPLLEVEMLKKCTLLWRERILKSKCTKHTILGPLLEVEMLKKRTLLWREHILKSKCTKHTILGPLLEVEMLKKCTLL